LLNALPAETTEERFITDDYLYGTRLRLRKVQSGSETLFKLCQKIRVNEGDPERVKITNIYISSDEYILLNSLPSSTIVKSRHKFSDGHVVYAIDQFHRRHSGLVLAETELTESQPRHGLPSFARCEVTSDNRLLSVRTGPRDSTTHRRRVHAGLNQVDALLRLP
jgi:CYTH domain-containing protein